MKKDICTAVYQLWLLSVFVTGHSKCHNPTRVNAYSPQYKHEADRKPIRMSHVSIEPRIKYQCNDNKKVLPEDDLEGSKHVGVCYD
jgi:hypothetical protein